MFRTADEYRQHKAKETQEQERAELIRLLFDFKTKEDVVEARLALKRYINSYDFDGYLMEAAEMVQRAASQLELPPFSELDT